MNEPNVCMMNGCCGAYVDDEENLSSPNRFSSLLQIQKLIDVPTGRSIIFAVGGDPHGSPVLFFPPLSGSCRMLLAIHDDLMNHSIKAICVNRPGTKGTTPAKSVQDHTEQTCSDALAVLDFLEIERVGLFCMCAGSTFAFLFSMKHPDKTTGKMLGLAPWTLPADCPHSKPLDRLAASLPTLPFSVLAASMETTMMALVSKYAIASLVDQGLSKREQAFLSSKYSTFFSTMLEWILEEPESNAHDVAVCLSSSGDLGLDYTKVKGDMSFYQGDDDEMAPVPATEWLVNQFSPAAKLTTVSKGTHSGALFILDSQLSMSLTFLFENKPKGPDTNVTKKLLLSEIKNQIEVSHARRYAIGETKTNEEIFER